MKLNSFEFKFYTYNTTKRAYMMLEYNINRGISLHYSTVGLHRYQTVFSVICPTSNHDNIAYIQFIIINSWVKYSRFSDGEKGHDNDITIIFIITFLNLPQLVRSRHISNITVTEVLKKICSF